MGLYESSPESGRFRIGRFVSCATRDPIVIVGSDIPRFSVTEAPKEDRQNPDVRSCAPRVRSAMDASRLLDGDTTWTGDELLKLDGAA